MRANSHRRAEWKEHGNAVAGTLMVMGSMLVEWKLPIEKAIKGLRMAYKLAQKKERK